MALRHDPIRDAYRSQTETNLERLKHTKMPPQRFIASEIGYCRRRIWYRHMGYIPSVFTARGSDYGRDGDAHHDLVRTFMADVGGAVIGAVKRNKAGLLAEETFAQDVQVKHKGHMLTLHVRIDGTIKLGRSEAVLEIKSIGNKDYWAYNNVWTQTLSADDVANHMAEHNMNFIYQAHVGMFATKLKQAAIVLKGRDCCATGLHSQRDPDQILGYVPIKWSPAIWTQVLNRCAIVQKAKDDKKPPRAEFLQSSKECGYCPFFHLCHGAVKAQKRGEPVQHPQLGDKLHVKDLK